MFNKTKTCKKCDIYTVLGHSVLGRFYLFFVRQIINIINLKLIIVVMLVLVFMFKRDRRLK